ncbi:MAG: S9 family peptidase, partial [Acidobacteria bacterium]|nr:S9 family peptidase [Acidobacteriota bacterium]
MSPRLGVLAALVVAFASLAAPARAQKLQYPDTKRVDQSDTYFGVKVEDPYRWLEDDRSPETAQWVEAENKVTFGYLEQIPFRAGVKARLEKLYNYARYSAPFRKGDYYYYSKNDGLQNQNVFYRQKGLGGTPELLINPNKFSADGTSRLAGFALSKDGKYL